MPSTKTNTAPLQSFRPMNTAYNAVFTPGQLSIGLVVPIETYASSAVPQLRDHIERVQLAESLGFSAVWLRDVPFNVPSFGDAGQVFDPFVYLGALAMQTTDIALGVASVILPLRHPAHVAKAAATADVLSHGRLLLGIASGDRPEEYPALGIDFEDRRRLFRESYDYIREMADSSPQFSSSYGRVGNGIDMLPKPRAQHLPLLITGSSQQSNEWIAVNADGWMTYPRPASVQRAMISDYRERIAVACSHDKPVMEPLYIDLASDPDTPPTPIHLGLRLGAHALRAYLHARKAIGVNHIALNLRFNQTDTPATLAALSEHIIPYFHTEDSHDD
ncbi:MAG: LLM class oxidoreductase [Pseudomonadota bacterium]